jgi:5-methylcytosine-specific restriction endonuclease McrA
MAKRNKKTRHHIIPSSRGGKNLENNLAYLPKERHEAYHFLFDNKTPDEIIDCLVNNYWNGQKI